MIGGASKSMKAELTEIRTRPRTDIDGGEAGRGWATVFGSFVCMMFSPSTMAMLSFGIFTPYLIESFGWSVRQVSLAATFISLATIVAVLIQGVVVDRVGSRRLILWSAPAFGLGYGMFAFQTGALWQFYLGWVLVPLLGVGLWPGSYSRATASWFSRHLGLAMAIATVGIGIGTIILPLLLGVIIGHHGWRSAYLYVGLLAAVLVWSVAFLFVRERKAEPVKEHLAEPRRVFPWHEFSRPTFRKLAIAFLLLGIVSSLITTHQVLLLMGNGVPRADAVAMQAFTGGALVLGRIATGFMVDRVGVRAVMVASSTLAAIGIVLLLGGATGAAAACAIALLGLLVGAEVDVMGFVAKRHFHMAIYGVTYGTLFALFHVGNAIGASGIAALYDSAGNYRGALLGLIVVLTVIVVVFGTIERAPPQTSLDEA
jgi:MFS family permease